VGYIIEVVSAIFSFDVGVGVVFVLAAIGFVATTVLLVTRAIKAMMAAAEQSQVWLRDSGRLTHADAATPELPAEPPAVVNLLLTRGKISRTAVRATVLDLTARGELTLYQSDREPNSTVILNVRRTGAALTAYEERVMREIEGKFGTLAAPVRLSSLAFLQPQGMRRWHRQFRKEVQADARQRGLTRLDAT
jgi:hypothetical protein